MNNFNDDIVNNFIKNNLFISIVYGNNASGKTILFNELLEKFKDECISLNGIFDFIKNSNTSQEQLEIMNENKQKYKKIKSFTLNECEINEISDSFNKINKNYLNSKLSKEKLPIKEIKIFKNEQSLKINESLLNKKKDAYVSLKELCDSFKEIKKHENAKVFTNKEFKSKLTDFVKLFLNFINNKNNKYYETFNVILSKNIFDDVKSVIENIYIYIFLCFEKTKEEFFKIKSKIEENNKKINSIRIEEESLKIINEILNVVLDNEKCTFEFEEYSNNLNIVINKNKINIKKLIKLNLLKKFSFSDSEIMLINLIICFIFLSTNNLDREKHFLVDCVDSIFDEKLRIIMLYLFNLFAEKNNLKFIIFTNNKFLIDEMKKITANIENKIEIYFLYKLNNESSIFELKKTNSEESDFFSFNEAVKQIKKQFTSIFINDKNLNIRQMMIIYILWIIRIFNMMKTYRKEEKVITKLLDYNLLFENYDLKKINEKIQKFFKKDESDNKFTKKISSYLNKEFKKEIKEFNNYFLNSIDDYFKKLNDLNKLRDIYDVFNINLKNIISIILLRMNLRYMINDLCKPYKSCFKDDGEFKEKLKFLEKEGKIDKNKFNMMFFLLVNIDNFIHIEKSPNLAIKGIEIDNIYVEKLIKIFHKINK